VQQVPGSKQSSILTDKEAEEAIGISSASFALGGKRYEKTNTTK
jgi:hypothetical protein